MANVHNEQCSCNVCMQRVMRNVDNGKPTPYADGRANAYVMAVNVETEQGSRWVYTFKPGVSHEALQAIVSDMQRFLAKISN